MDEQQILIDNLTELKELLSNADSWCEALRGPHTIIDKEAWANMPEYPNCEPPRKAIFATHVVYHSNAIMERINLLKEVTGERGEELWELALTGVFTVHGDVELPLEQSLSERVYEKIKDYQI